MGNIILGIIIGMFIMGFFYREKNNGKSGEEEAKERNPFIKSI